MVYDLMNHCGHLSPTYICFKTGTLYLQIINFEKNIIMAKMYSIILKRVYSVIIDFLLINCLIYIIYNHIIFITFRSSSKKFNETTVKQIKCTASNWLTKATEKLKNKNLTT